MKTVLAFFRSVADRHTYDPRANAHLWFGFFWGIPIPMFFLILTERADDPAMSDLIHSPWLLGFFLLHPPFFAWVFGVLGAMRRELEKENARLIEELRAQAWVDSLTGLYNRRYVMEEFRNILRRASRSGAPVQAVLFDLDGFKSVNDVHGHLAGDIVLQKAAAALKGAIRLGDLLGRFGGDEFLLVTQGDAHTTREIVARCGQAVLDASGLSISAGVAGVAGPGDTPEALIQRADDDLSESKRRRYETTKVTRRKPP
jgi:diguanylate cyclase (GGDEF)-like protein